MTAALDELLEDGDMDSLDAFINECQDSPDPLEQMVGEIMRELLHRRSEVHILMQVLAKLQEEHPDARSTLQTVRAQQDSREMQLPERALPDDDDPETDAPPARSPDPRPDVTDFAQPPLDHQ